ncbi:MAG: ComEC/Rec2 family competence protein [Fimbriimonadaceae bacterium]
MNRELTERPFLLASIGLACGLASATFPAALIGVLAVLVALIIPSPKDLPARVPAAAWVLGPMLVGWVLAPRIEPSLSEAVPFDGDAQVVRMPKLFNDSVQCLVRVDKRLAVAYFSLEQQPSLGDVWQVGGRLRPLSETQDRFWPYRGVTARLQIASATRVRSGPTVFRWADEWRRAMIALTSSVLPAESASLVEALCFNLDGRLSMETADELRATGTTHIIAASGLQVVLFASALNVVLALVPIGRTWQLGLLFAVLAMYAMATGLNAPVVRATIMAATYYSAYLVRREPDWLSALGFSSLLYLLWQPWGVFDVGFQLSYLCVAALAAFAVRDEEGRPLWYRWILSRIWDGARATMICTFVAAPLVAYQFGQVSVVGVAANLGVLFLVPPTIVLAMSGLAVHALWPAAGVGLVGLAGLLAGTMGSIIEWFSRLPGALIGSPGFSPWWMVPYYLGLILLFRPKVRHA